MIFDPKDLNLEIEGSAWFCCPIIDPVHQQQGGPLLQKLLLGVFCSFFEVKFCVLDCYYELSEHTSQIHLLPLSEGDSMHASISCHYLLLLEVKEG